MSINSDTNEPAFHLSSPAGPYQAPRIEPGAPVQSYYNLKARYPGVLSIGEPGDFDLRFHPQESRIYMDLKTLYALRVAIQWNVPLRGFENIFNLFVPPVKVASESKFDQIWGLQSFLLKKPEGLLSNVKFWMERRGVVEVSVETVQEVHDWLQGMGMDKSDLLKFFGPPDSD
jgi:hypothetical protein